MVVRKDKVLILAAFGLAVAAVAAFRFLGGAGADPVGGPPLKPSEALEFRGFSLHLHTNDPACPFETFVDEIARTGANTICFVVSAQQENCASTSLFIDQRRTPPVGRIRSLIRLARKKGLRVVLMPIVLLENPRQYEWRGRISPANANWDDWWEDYRNYILHYAALAQLEQAEVFMVGSELVSTESQTDRWRDLIHRVRQAYKGRVSYSANWDHYRPIQWWRDLDIIGMTTYYDLTGGKQPTIEKLNASWRTIKKKILTWRRTINRPILFTEVGWPNQVTCAQYPWDYYRSEGRPDQTAQANCFESFFQTWIAEKSVAGFLVWEWRSYAGQDIGPNDTSYVPCGKKAMQVIRKYFRGPGPRRKGAATQPQPSRDGAGRARTIQRRAASPTAPG